MPKFVLANKDGQIHYVRNGSCDTPLSLKKYVIIGDREINVSDNLSPYFHTCALIIINTDKHVNCILKKGNSQKYKPIKGLNIQGSQFLVPHFSRYRLDEDSDDEEETNLQLKPLESPQARKSLQSHRAEKIAETTNVNDFSTDFKVSPKMNDNTSLIGKKDSTTDFFSRSFCTNQTTQLLKKSFFEPYDPYVFGLKYEKEKSDWPNLPQKNEHLVSDMDTSVSEDLNGTTIGSSVKQGGPKIILPSSNKISYVSPLATLKDIYCFQGPKNKDFLIHGVTLSPITRLKRCNPFFPKCSRPAWIFTTASQSTVGIKLCLTSRFETSSFPRGNVFLTSNKPNQLWMYEINHPKATKNQTNILTNLDVITHQFTKNIGEQLLLCLYEGKTENFLALSFEMAFMFDNFLCDNNNITGPFMRIWSLCKILFSERLEKKSYNENSPTIKFNCMDETESLDNVENNTPLTDEFTLRNESRILKFLHWITQYNSTNDTQSRQNRINKMVNDKHFPKKIATSFFTDYNLATTCDSLCNEGNYRNALLLCQTQFAPNVISSSFNDSLLENKYSAKTNINTNNNMSDNEINSSFSKNNLNAHRKRFKGQHRDLLDILDSETSFLQYLSHMDSYETLEEEQNNPINIYDYYKLNWVQSIGLTLLRQSQTQHSHSNLYTSGGETSDLLGPAFLEYDNVLGLDPYATLYAPGQKTEPDCTPFLVCFSEAKTVTKDIDNSSKLINQPITNKSFNSNLFINSNSFMGLLNQANSLKFSSAIDIHNNENDALKILGLENRKNEQIAKLVHISPLDTCYHIISFYTVYQQCKMELMCKKTIDPVLLETLLNHLQKCLSIYGLSCNSKYGPTFDNDNDFAQNDTLTILAYTNSFYLTIYLHGIILRLVHSSMNDDTKEHEYRDVKLQIFTSLYKSMCKILDCVTLYTLPHLALKHKSADLFETILYENSNTKHAISDDKICKNRHKLYKNNHIYVLYDTMMELIKCTKDIIHNCNK